MSIYSRHHHRHRYFRRRMAEYLDHEDRQLTLEGPGTNSLAAWFLGPMAENKALLQQLLTEALDAHCRDRVEIFPEDPPYVTDARRDAAYHEALARLKFEHRRLLLRLRGSVPFFSYRYQAHMNWDLTIPGIAGYFAAMLYNQNNVALEASPVTAELEAAVGMDLCAMLGFAKADPIAPWGHVTCDGSIANLEGLWVARNLRYYAVSLAAAVANESVLAAARGIEVTLGSGESARLLDLDAWAQINLPGPEILDLPGRIQAAADVDAGTLSDCVEPYLLQERGVAAFLRDLAPNLPLPVLFGPATKHYSWPKNAAILGIGRQHFTDVPVDENARMCMDNLRAQLQDCLDNRRPVLCVVAVLGSTEESAVDPLAEVLALREDFRRRGLEFHVHVDAAWGGYFASLLREPAAPARNASAPAKPESAPVQDTPMLDLSPYVRAQYEALPGADTATVDPHKAGYIPYPAGALCYRDGRMRELVAFAAPEVFHDEDPTSNMGIYGVEGSKPGAAAAAVYLSHQVIRPDRSGYGQILGRALFNSKRYYAAVVTMAEPDDPFVVVPVQQVPAEREQQGPAAIAKQLAFIRERIVAPENDALVADDEAMALLRQLGSDQIIITYAFNFKTRDGALNRDPERLNAFTQKIFEKLSLSANPQEHLEQPVFITTSVFTVADYGENFVRTFMRRLGVWDDEQAPIDMNFLSSTTMSPWLTATATGNYLHTLIPGFRAAVSEIAVQFRDQP